MLDCLIHQPGNELLGTGLDPDEISLEFEVKWNIEKCQIVIS